MGFGLKSSVVAVSSAGGRAVGRSFGALNNTSASQQAGQ